MFGVDKKVTISKKDIAAENHTMHAELRLKIIDSAHVVDRVEQAIKEALIGTPDSSGKCADET